ncbi:hypothetical protein ABJ851_004035 [Shigella flexneri]|nr:hypothetical protein [Escherichia coli]
MNRSVFYSHHYNKYFALFSFDGFDYDGNIDRNALVRIPVLVKGGYFIVRVNNKQLSDLSYGSENNPVPVFGVTVSSRGYDTDWVLKQDRGHFDVSDKINRVFVEQYLNYFLPEEDFKKLFVE